MSRVQQALLRIHPTEALENSNGAAPTPLRDGVGGSPAGISALAGQTDHSVLPDGVSNEEIGLYSKPDLSNPLNKQVLKLVRSVFLFQNSHSPGAVVFSSVEGAGSSEICLRSAELLAVQSSARVCLVSANPAHPPSLVEQIKSRGLAEAIVNSNPIKEFVVRTNHRNLWLMPPGSSVTASPNLLPPERLRTRITELKNEFDYVLIDAPPVNSPNTVVLGQAADGVILILEANSTRRETALLAKETFERAGVRLLGAVLNNRTFPIPETLYRKL